MEAPAFKRLDGNLKKRVIFIRGSAPFLRKV
jgi:hypothetical protein